MDNNLTTGKVDDQTLRQQAEKYLKEVNGQWMIQFDQPVQGFDPSKTYVNRDQALEQAFNLLKTRQGIRAA